MTGQYEGGCQCGAVRYRVGEPLSVYACHCTDCQRRSGSAFGITLLAARDRFEVIAGAPARYERAQPGGARWTAAYCGHCAVRLWSEQSVVEGVLFVAAGTLDDTRWLEPVAHVWTGSAQPWVPIPEGTLRFERQPASVEPLVRAWQERR